MDHFEILGQAPVFELDINALKVRYRDLLRQFHPDKFASATEVEKRIALQKSAQINDAYQTLLNPISRAEYLLSLQGISLEQQSMKDVSFLMQQMELREKLEQIEQKANDSALFDFSDEVNALFQNALAKLSADCETKDWQQVASSVQKIKFLAKLQTEVERIEEQLF